MHNLAALQASLEPTVNDSSVVREAIKLANLLCIEASSEPDTSSALVGASAPLVLQLVKPIVKQVMTKLTKKKKE